MVTEATRRGIVILRCSYHYPKRMACVYLVGLT